MDKSNDIAEGSIPLDNKQHEQLCHEYLIDYNGQKSGERAGYSKKTARTQVSELLTKPDISARLAYLSTLRAKKATKTVDDIERELEKLAFSDPTNIIHWDESGASFVKNSSEIDPEHSAAIEQIEVTELAMGKEGDAGLILKTKLKMHPKIKALELLGKHKGMFIDKLELSADDDFTNALAQALNQRDK